ncbi:MAG: hypothetical protein M1814_006153 [Vezdaea aestivalis]|nr:MAG: hypothetical protein M1814_006153 [Vezdaea aestivalis]
MASQALNGAEQLPEPSPAATLLQKHEAGHPPAPTVEEIIDEEDILHPPPSSAPPTNGGAAVNGASKGKPQVVPDTLSNEMFPELGSIPKASSKQHSTWTAPPKINTRKANGAASKVSSGTSSPRSGLTTPASKLASGRTGPAFTTLPGRHSDHVVIPSADIKPQSQLKKSLKETIQDISRRSKAQVEMKQSQNGGIKFEATGPQHAVRGALETILRELTVKRIVKMEVPSSVRSFIIGQQGKMVQAISKDTGAKIQLPKSTSTSNQEDDDDIEIQIEGDSLSIHNAKARIQAIVNERGANAKQRLKAVPAEFYPFLAKLHASRPPTLDDGREVRVHIPEFHTWTHPPPQVDSTVGRPTFRPSTGPLIEIHGERSAVQQVRAEIERQVQELHQTITCAPLELSRSQHQFVIGPKGMKSDDFLLHSSCVVIFPPSNSESEDITIVGPEDRIEVGLTRAMELAMDMKTATFDVLRQHPQAYNVGRYLRQRPEIRELEMNHNAHIAIPESRAAPQQWIVYSREGPDCLRAKTEVQNLIRGIPPTRMTPFKVDPFYHQHMEATMRERLQKQYGVHALFPDEKDENQDIVLVYESQYSEGIPHELHRQAPTNVEVDAFVKALAQATNHLSEIQSMKQRIATKPLDVPRKFLDKTKAFVTKYQKSLPPDTFPVQIRPLVRPDQSVERPDILTVVLRGPERDVDTLFSKIQAFLEQEAADEKERDYTVSFPYPQKFVNVLIGKGGESINKLRDEFDVEVQVGEGTVEVKGPPAKAEAAKAKILTLKQRLEDEATHVLKVKPLYHRDLIGSKGALVNKLQDRYNVKINFPRSGGSPDDSHSVADSSSEAGNDRKGNRPHQAPDEVVIRGPKKGADAARDELQSLLQYTVENSHTASISVARSQLPLLIGQAGREMENLRLATGASIDVPDQRKDETNPKARVEIKVKGTKKQVEEAKKLLEQKAKVFDDTIVRTISIDKTLHKALIGSGGANIRDIILAAGGSGDHRDLSRTVRFPNAESSDSTIKIEAPSAVANAVYDSLATFASEREGQITLFIDVPTEQHRLLIGRGGDSKRALEGRFSVSIEVPRQGSTETKVKVTGKPPAVEKAKAHVENLIKENKGVTVDVPAHLHHTIVNGGAFIQNLKNNLQVSVSHAGTSLPPKPDSALPPAALPLITETANDVVSWHIADLHNPSDSGTTIPWVLRGSEKSVGMAKTQIEKAVAEAGRPSCIGFLRLPNPRSYRFIIGHAGSQINSIRKKTGTKISVPRDQATSDPVEIRGSREGVEKAKEIIMDCVEEGENGRNGHRY